MEKVLTINFWQAYKWIFLPSDVSCFQGFFNFPDMQPILKHFCVYHVNAPGQEQGAAQLPEK